jgi:hypothetical protein
MKNYYTMNNVGKAKYTINFHDGQTKHPDGSPFYGIYIFANKKAFQIKLTELKKQGYTEK